MAIPQNTLIGKTKQSVGGTTFSSWKGINVLKAKAVSVANPRTIAQQNQRAKITALLRIFQAAPDPINLGMCERAVQMSGYNAFTSINSRNGAVTATDGTATIVPASVVISAGSLLATEDLAATATVGDAAIDITWSTTITGNQLTTDKLQVLILSSTGEVKGYDANAATRSAGTATVNYSADYVYAATDVVLVGFVNFSAKKAELTQVVAVS